MFVAAQLFDKADGTLQAKWRHMRGLGVVLSHGINVDVAVELHGLKITRRPVAIDDEGKSGADSYLETTERNAQLEASPAGIAQRDIRPYSPSPAASIGPRQSVSKRSGRRAYRNSSRDHVI